jgi:hypothetical protein
MRRLLERVAERGSLSELDSEVRAESRPVGIGRIDIPGTGSPSLRFAASLQTSPSPQTHLVIE